MAKQYTVVNRRGATMEISPNPEERIREIEDEEARREQQEHLEDEADNTDDEPEKSDDE